MPETENDDSGVTIDADTVLDVRVSQSVNIARAVILSIAWACTSSALIFLNNHLLREHGFSYPMILCSMGMTSSWLISFLCITTGRVKRKHAGLITRGWYARHILPIGCLGAASLGFGNYVYLYLSVSFIQMLKSAVPAVTMAVMYAAGLERLHGTTLTGVAVVTIGTFIAAYGEVKCSAIGVLMMLTSAFAEAIRTAFYQYVLGNLKFDLMEGLYVTAPASLAFLGLGIVTLELIQFVRERGWEIIAAAPHYFLVAAFMGFGANILTLGVIKATSGLTYKVMGQAKNAAVILLAVILFGNPVTAVQLIGYAMSLFGFFIYQRGKTQQDAEEAEKEN